MKVARWLALVGWWVVAAAALPGSVGTGQKVAVVVGRYRDSDPPRLNSQQWCDGLNQFVNPWYTVATDGLTNFEFIPVPGVCNFDFRPAVEEMPKELADRISIFREGQAAVDHAVSRGVNVDDVTRFLVVGNGDVRGLSTGGHWPIYKTNRGPLTPLSLAVIAESDGQVLFDPTVDPNAIQTRVQIATPAHELGHQLGQFDLYNEFSPPEFAAAWSPMGIQCFQRFDAYTRILLGWLPPARVVNLAMPLQGTIDRIINLVPQGVGGPNPQAVRFNFLPEPAASATSGFLFHGYQAEARPRTGLDENLPDSYEPGVLIALVNQRLPYGSFQVRERQTTDRLQQAAFAAGQTFADEEIGLRVTPLAANGEVQPLRVRWTAPPRPDVALRLDTPLGETRDIWIDSPSNGFGTFTFPNVPGDNVPSLCGDFPFVPYAIPWNDPDGNGPLPAVPGLPEPRPVDHRLAVRVSNVGSAPAQNIRGHVVFLEPGLPAFDWERPETLLDLGERASFDIPVLAANASTVRQVTFRPKGVPFMAIVWLDRVDLEINLSNQLAGEAFIIHQPAPGSPYQPVQVDLKLTNLVQQAKTRVLATTPHGVPSTWRSEINSFHFGVERGGAALFKAVFQAPEFEKPQLVRPTLTGWMGYGDGFIKIGELPVYVDLSRKTKLTLDAQGGDGKIALRSRLTPGKAGLAITIAVTGSDGSLQYVGARKQGVAFLQTNAQGEVAASLETQPGVSYTAFATFDGGPGFAPAQSPAVRFGVVVKDTRVIGRPTVPR